MPTSPARAQIPGGPSRHAFDTIVMGGQLGGAVAAAVLAKRGYRVLHVEHDGMGHGYAHEGWLLPYAPFLAPQLKGLPLVEAALEELGLNTAAQRSLKPHACLQVVMPDHRLDLAVGEARQKAELTREFGSEAPAQESALREAGHQHETTNEFFKHLQPLPATRFLERWRLRGAIRACPALGALPAVAAPGPVTSLVRQMAPFIQYLDAPPGPLPLSRALAQILNAPHQFPGGREGFRELLYRKLQDLGGVYLGAGSSEEFVVEELTIESNRATRLRVVGSGNEYTASTFIAAMDSPALRRVLPTRKRQKKLNEMLDLASTRRFLLAVNVVMRADALPRGMGDLVLLETPGDELGPLLLQVQGARRTDSKVDDEAMRVVCAAAFVPITARERGEGHLHELVERVSAHLDRLMPFSRNSRVLVSTPYLDAGGVRGSRLMPHPLYAFESASALFDPAKSLGVAGLPQRSPVKNLVLANREILPGLGLEGEFLAGLRAAALVQEQFKKKDPLRA